jgi:phosphoenolpyruvate carboxykinase (ATP)
MLSAKMKEGNVNVWLVNTGWTGGSFGVGKRMSLKYTRALITAALNGQLDNVAYKQHDIFGIEIPGTCPQVPSEILDPRMTWKDADQYDQKALFLANAFTKNFEKYVEFANEETLYGGPHAKAAYY